MTIKKLLTLAAAVLMAGSAWGQVTIDTDLTSQFSALTKPANWTTGAGGAAGETGTWACPAVTTNAGQTVNMCEFYETNCNRSGDLLYQTVTGLNSGTYKIELYGGAAFCYGRGFTSAFCTDNKDANEELTSGYHIDTETGVYLFAQTSEGTYEKEIPVYYATTFPKAAEMSLEGVVVGEDGKVKIGLKKTSTYTNWHIVQLKGVTATIDADAALSVAVSEANAIKESSVPATMYTEIQTVVAENNKTYATGAEYTAAIDAINAVVKKANSYASAKAYLDKMASVLDNTNVYTAEAYDAQYGSWLAKYNAATLTNEEASSLNADKAFSTGWHASNNIDDVLLSTWTVDGEQATNYDKALYINTWSVEGNTDGSEFYAPFFEYWTGDANSLDARTLQSKITGLTPNAEYGFSLRARARNTNNKTIEAGKIMLQVGEGEAVDISAGTQFGTTQFYIGNYIATGMTDAEGTLTVTIKVEAESNVSWLSYYDCNYVDATEINAAKVAAAKGDLELAIKDASTVKMLDAVLFGKSESATTAFAKAKADAQTVYDNDAATLEDVETAIENLNNATAAYKADVNAPVAGKAYFLVQNASGLYLNLTDGVKVTSEAYAVQFIANGTGWTIASVDNAEVTAGMAGNNTWSMSNSKVTAWTLTPTVSGDAVTYEIVGPNGSIGTDNITSGSTCYGNKNGEKAVWTIETDYAVATLAVTAANGYATFVAPFEVAIPEGVTASTVTDVNDDNEIVLAALTGVIPANTPVVLESAADVNVTVYGVAEEGTPVAGLLTGVYADTPAPAGSYVLQNHDGEVKFYLVESVQPTVTAGHAYLTAPAAGVKALGFSGTATGIKNLTPTLSEGEGAIYNVNGQLLNTLQRGINIVGGKKVLVK